MTNVRSLTISAAAALLLVAGTGCADSSDPPTSTPSSSSPSAPSSSATPSESELASQRAEALVRRYFAVLDEVRQEPHKRLRALAAVATSSQLTAIENLVRREREQGLRQEGATRVVELKVQAVNLDNSDPNAGKVPTVAIDVCWDVGAVDLVDRTGKSVISPARPDTGGIRYTVANYHWSKDRAGGWRIASGEDLEKAPCAPS
jgi:hypothetical protein